MVAVNLVNDMGIDRIGGKDAIRLGLLQDVAARALFKLPKASRLFSSAANCPAWSKCRSRRPGAKRVRPEVSFLQNVVDKAQAALKHVQHLDFDLIGDQFQSVGHVAGRGVVAVAKARP